MSTEKIELKNIPDWDVCDVKVLKGKATPLERFIYHNEPAGEKSKQFRNELSELITYIQSFYDR